MIDRRYSFPAGAEPEWLKCPGGPELFEKMQRADTFAGACEGLKVAIAHEEDPGYREYLANVVLPFVESERSRANKQFERHNEHFEVA